MILKEGAALIMNGPSDFGFYLNPFLFSHFIFICNLLRELAISGGFVACGGNYSLTLG